MAEPGSTAGLEARIRELELRIAALENVIRVQGSNVTVQVPGALALNANRVDVTAADDFYVTAQDDIRFTCRSGIRMHADSYCSIGTYELTIKGDAFTMRGQSLDARFGADMLVKAGASLTVKAATTAEVDIAGALTMKSGRDLQIRSTEAFRLLSGKGMSLSSEKGLSVAAADSVKLGSADATQEMKANGNIEIKGRDVSIVGSGKVDLRGLTASSLPRPSSDAVVRGTKVGQN